MPTTPSEAPSQAGLPAGPADAPPPRVHAAALQRQLRRMTDSGRSAWLHEEVARRMGERLALLRRPPERLIDWASPTGASTALLRRHAPTAQVLPLDFEGRPLPQPGSRSGLAGRLQRWLGRGAAATTPDNSTSAPQAAGDLLWANMMLHWVDDLPALLQRWHAAVSVDGLLMFSCFGPDTLRELQALYARMGWGQPASRWIDMHDIGDALVRAGFADPVMDMEQLTLTWPSAEALLSELHELGGNTAVERFSGLRTPRWRKRLHQALGESLQGPDGRLQLRFEIIYGHALRPAPRPIVSAQTTISLDTMREMTRRTPPPR